MSFERAYKNCRICYVALKKDGVELLRENKKDLIGEFAYSNLAERSMKEAMIALEDTIRNIFPSWIASGICKEEMEIASNALKACVKCELRHPCIADLLEKEQPEIFKPEEEQEE